jgi:hypothetical protein
MRREAGWGEGEEEALTVGPSTVKLQTQADEGISCINYHILEQFQN